MNRTYAKQAYKRIFLTVLGEIIVTYPVFYSIRGGRGEEPAVVENALGRDSARIIAATGASQWEGVGGKYLATSKLPKGYLDRKNWPDMISWLVEEESRFRAVAMEIMESHSQ